MSTRVSGKTLYSNAALAANDSASMKLDPIDHIALQAVYSGTFSGTLKLQASNDNINWSDIPGTSTAISAAGNTIFTIAWPPYGYVNFVYTRTSGTVNLVCTVNGVQVGGK